MADDWNPFAQPAKKKELGSNSILGGIPGFGGEFDVEETIQAGGQAVVDGAKGLFGDVVDALTGLGTAVLEKPKDPSANSGSVSIGGRTQMTFDQARTMADVNPELRQQQILQSLQEDKREAVEIAQDIMTEHREQQAKPSIDAQRERINTLNGFDPAYLFSVDEHTGEVTNYHGTAAMLKEEENSRGEMRNTIFEMASGKSGGAEINKNKENEGGAVTSGSSGHGQG